jgi:hypothetical protein
VLRDVGGDFAAAGEAGQGTVQMDIRGVEKFHKKASTSFLKKRSKKLLFLEVRLLQHTHPKEVKVFWFFFSKKNILAYSLSL